MLRNHFQHSQFIVVSLKEGMFNNANVLFKTKFVDGVSTVTSTSRAPVAMAQRERENEERTGRKAKRQKTGPRAALLPHSAN